MWPMTYQPPPSRTQRASDPQHWNQNNRHSSLLCIPHNGIRKRNKWFRVRGVIVPKWGRHPREWQPLACTRRRLGIGEMRTRVAATARIPSASRRYYNVPNFASQFAWRSRALCRDLAPARRANSISPPAPQKSRSGAPRFRAISLSSRVFSMAMTACAAKFLTSSICLSLNGRTSCR